MAEHVQSGCQQPDDEARLVQRQQRAAPVRSGEQQCDAAREDHHGREHDQRCEQPHLGRWRTLAPVGRIRRVIAHEPVSGARRLQRDGSDQQHPEEHVGVQQLPDPQDRHTQRGKQDQQHDTRGGRQLLITRRTAGNPGDATGTSVSARPSSSRLAPICVQRHVVSLDNASKERITRR